MAPRLLLNVIHRAHILYIHRIEFVACKVLVLGNEQCRCLNEYASFLLGKNLLKLYMNDVGILTSIFFGTNIKAVMDDVASINLGSVYETVVAQELKAHGFNLYYYDNKKTGEVDYLIDDMEHLSVLPLEIKSGKDYQVHSALDKFLQIKEYNIQQAFVLSNAQQVEVKDGITYLPIYYIMCIEPKEAEDTIF